jgi:hypothetical protein
MTGRESFLDVYFFSKTKIAMSFSPYNLSLEKPEVSVQSFWFVPFLNEKIAKG